MYFVVCYDIEDDKQRDKLANLLNNYGVKVNYSVYEIKIEKKELRDLIKKILQIIDKKNSVRFYNLSKDTIIKSFEIFNGKDIFSF
jgi:CRISPR-associated protein Cas2